MQTRIMLNEPYAAIFAEAPILSFCCEAPELFSGLRLSTGILRFCCIPCHLTEKT